jgi:hypothetical protein
VIRSLGRRRVTIRFGEPILVEREPAVRARKERVPALTTQLLDQIAELARLIPDPSLR